MKTCCFTGYRPKFFPWKNNPPAEFLHSLKKEILHAIQDGFTEFICGDALGTDTWAAQILLSLKENHKNIRLHIALPFEGYNGFITDKNYIRIIKNADTVKIISGKKGAQAFTQRDRYIIDHSSRVIAVYDERSNIKS